MSLRASRSAPLNCSGLMYGGVPRTMPACVSFCSFAAAFSSLFAMPKSSTFTKSSSPARLVRKMFAGLRSRWTTPFSCASCSDPQTCPMMRSTRSGIERALLLQQALERLPVEELHRDVQVARASVLPKS
jgi:hypothetical protein